MSRKVPVQPDGAPESSTTEESTLRGGRLETGRPGERRNLGREYSGRGPPEKTLATGLKVGHWGRGTEVTKIQRSWDRSRSCTLCD